jgi:gallate decarboxylase subunit C
MDARGSGREAAEITDLRSALEFLSRIPGQLVSTDVPVDPHMELAGVYRRVGAGTPVATPTRVGPAMLFRTVKGSLMQVVAGVLASRLRTALLLGTTPERLAFDLLAAVQRPVLPVLVPAAGAPCQEVVIRPPFDLRTLLPATTSTARDAGAFLNRESRDGSAALTTHRLRSA